MGRHKEPVRLKQAGKYWYYKTPDMPVFKTTGESTELELQKLFANPADSMLWHTPSDYICVLIAKVLQV